MDEIWARFIGNLGDRVSGPMQFRVLLQPLIAATLAIIGGLRDYRAGKPAYFFGLLTQPGHRREMLRDGWKSVSKVFLIAIVLDVVYQIIVLKTVYPGEAIIVALILAIVPYLIIRGLTNRLARLFSPRSPTTGT